MTTDKISIAHAALWTRDLERLCAFWVRVFGATAGEIYRSQNRPGYSSRFLRFADGPTLEVMTGPWVHEAPRGETAGYAHLALSIGSAAAVDRIAALMAQEGALASAPLHTGDGFYEAVIRDPDGNLIEITP